MGHWTDDDPRHYADGSFYLTGDNSRKINVYAGPSTGQDVRFVIDGNESIDIDPSDIPEFINRLKRMAAALGQPIAATPIADAVGGDESEGNTFVALVKEELSSLRARIDALESKE